MDKTQRVLDMQSTTQQMHQDWLGRRDYITNMAIAVQHMSETVIKLALLTVKPKFGFFITKINTGIYTVYNTQALTVDLIVNKNQEL